MTLLEGLKINNHEAAPYVILGVILFTLLLYCLPMVQRFFLSQKNHTTLKPGTPRDSNMVDHDLAFSGRNNPAKPCDSNMADHDRAFLGENKPEA